MICAKEELSLVTKQYIVQLNLLDKNFKGEKRVYVTKDENLAKNNIGKEDKLLNFYNLYLDKWITYDWTDIAMYTYPNYDMLVTQDDEDTHFLENLIDIIKDNPRVKDANEKVLNVIQERKKIFEDIVNEAKKFTELNNIDLNQELFLGEYFSNTNAYTKNKLLFNLIFNLEYKNYVNTDYNLDIIIEKYYQVLDYYANKAKKDLDIERADIDDSEMLEEIDSIEEILNDSVNENKEFCIAKKNSVVNDNYDKEDAIIDIMENWPPILFPVPEFICDNTDNDTLFEENIWLFKDTKNNE